ERSARLVGARRLVAQTAYWLGNVHLARGDLAAAEDRFRYVIEIVGDTDVTGRAYAMHGLAEVVRLGGDLGEARRVLTETAGLARQALDTVLEGRVYLSLAAVHEQEGRRDEQ